jgi:hypothetical protein
MTIMAEKSASLDEVELNKTTLDEVKQISNGYEIAHSKSSVF